jgi:hypothetical protein
MPCGRATVCNDNGLDVLDVLEKVSAPEELVFSTEVAVMVTELGLGIVLGAV